MQGVQQPPFANDIGRAIRFLCCQKPGGGHGARENMIVGNVDSEPAQLDGHVASRALAVVGEKQEGNVARQQFANESVCSGNELIATINHAIHVDQKTTIHCPLLSLCTFSQLKKAASAGRSLEFHRKRRSKKSREPAIVEDDRVASTCRMVT